MTLRESRPASPAIGAAQQIVDLISPLFGGLVPLRVRAWDGSVAGPDDAPTVVVNDPAALRRLIYRPGELGLAQAYVTGEIDVEGDLLDGFRRVWRAAREQDASPRLNPSTVVAGLRTARGLGLLQWSSLWRPPEPPASQARLRG